MENLESGLTSDNGSGAACHPGPDAGALGENGDKAIIAFRRVLLEKVQQLQSGEKGGPAAVSSVSDVFVVSELMPASEDWRDYCKKFLRKN